MPAGNPTAITLIRKQDPKGSVRAATTGALPANTRVGNVLTADANGALPAQDVVTLAVADPKERLLVKNEVAGANNGIYDVTDVGSGSTPWVLTRSPNFDSDEKVTSGAACFVSEGTVNAGREYTLLTADPITINTTSLTFDQTGGTTPALHAASHADGGADEVPVAGLAEAAAPSNDVSAALRPNGSGGVAFSDVAHADLTSVGADDHHAQDHKDRHKSGGADAFAAADVLEATGKRLQTTTGPTTLLVGAVADTEFLQRSGTAIIGASLSATHPVSDALELVKGSVDDTKRMRFEIDGFTAGAVRIITPPDKNITLDDVGDARAPTAHASDHTDGTDDIQNATAAQKGVATAAQITKLDGIAAGAVAEGAMGDTHAAIVTGNPHVLDATDVGAAPAAHVGAGGAAHADVVAAGADGFMTGADKTKLDGIAAGAEVNVAPNHLESFNANDAIFPATAQAAATSVNGHPLIAHDDTVDENTIYVGDMPQHYSAGNILVDIDFVAAAIVGDVVWGVEFERNSPGGTTLDSDSFAAQQTGAATTINGTTRVPTRTTITLTQAQADSIAAGDAFRMRVERLATNGGDDLVGDAQIRKITVRQ